MKKTILFITAACLMAKVNDGHGNAEVYLYYSPAYMSAVTACSK